MLISIIIPTLNNLENLKKCVLSIKNQTFKDYEVWIMDGNSQDGTKDFLKTLESPFFWVSKDDHGIYDAMNNGILHSKGEWIYFLGSDDKLFEKNTLSSVFKDYLNKNIKLIIGKIRYQWTENDSYFIRKNNGVINPSWSNKLWFRNTLPHQGIFYNKNVFLKDNYSLEYKILADYAFNLHLFNNRSTIKIIGNIIAVCNTNGISKKYNWNLYKEEISLKTKESNLLLKPLFILIGISKFFAKKLIF